MGKLLDRALRIKAGMNPPSRDTVKELMIAHCDSIVKEITDTGNWRASDKTRQLEQEIVKIQKDVLSGRGKLIDFKEACLKWKNAGQINNQNG